MPVLDHIAHLLLALLATLITLVLGALAAIEQVMRGAMEAVHLPHNLQTVVMILVAVAFLVGALRVFGGVIRVVVIVLLVLLLVHMLGAMPQGQVRL